MRQPFELRVVGVVARRARVPQVHRRQRAHLAERTGHVVVVTDPRDGAAGQVAEQLLHGQHVGQCLEGMGAVGQHVDDRDVDSGRESLHHGVVEDPRRDQRVVALEDAADVLNRLAHVEADLLAPRVHRVATELDDRDLHRVPGAVRGLLEDQRGTLPGERAAQLLHRTLGELEDRRQLLRREVGDVEQVARHQT